MTARETTLPNRLQELLDLPPNWDSYGSPPPTKAAIDTASRLLENLGVPFPFVAPISGGGIQIEITILPDGTVEP